VGYEIPLESVIDADIGRFAVQSYQLYPLLNNPFRLRWLNRPVLQVHQPIDRETQSTFQLKLIAFDGGEPVRSGEQIIEIFVTE
jgi:hypothetical protein